MQLESRGRTQTRRVAGLFNVGGANLLRFDVERRVGEVALVRQGLMSATDFVRDLGFTTFKFKLPASLW
jgi:hypothetical protein